MTKARENYTLGSVYDFRVKKKFSSQTEIVDENTGINAYLHNTEKLKLFKGQIVKCRVVDFGNNRPIVELVDLQDFSASSGLTDEKLAELLEQKHFTWDTKDFITLLLTDEKEVTFDEECHIWISKLIGAGVDLSIVRSDCSDLLELSDLLDLSGSAQRDFYEQRLSAIIELLGYYIRAGKLLKDGEQEDFVDTLFNKLRVSGFIYHPDKNFNILACLFLRRTEIMRRRIAELLKIICNRDINIWKKEPFNSALTKLLEIYIHECITKIDREKDPERGQLIDNIITSLTVQLLLAGQVRDQQVDVRLATARLCTMASYLNKANAQQLLDNSFSYLFNEDVRHLKIGIESIDNAHYILANFNPGGEVETPSSFSNGFAKLQVDASGISLRSSNPEVPAYPVFASDSTLWKGMQVYLSTKPVHPVYFMSGNLKSFRDTWADIENELFNSTDSQRPVVQTQRHHVGDEVEIVFLKQDVFDRNRFTCRIDDEKGGRGFITIDDIVPYSVNEASLSMFMPEGARVAFPARITDVDADGRFHFSMYDFIKEESADYDLDEDNVICRLGKTPNPITGLAPAVSSEGLSVSLKTSEEFRRLPAGTIVKCRLIGPSSQNFHIDCEVVDVVNDFQHEFSNSDAFSSLMKAFSEAFGKPVDETVDAIGEEEETDAETEMDEDYVRQLIHCIDRLAMLDEDYIRAYNYLAFGRLMCRLINWNSQATYYKGRMDIISMLYYFDVNSEIDEAELSQLEMANAQLFETNKPLQERFMQLQAVSYIGKPEHTPELYRLSERNRLLGTLAQLVIAYNVVSQEGMNSVAVSIHEKIKEVLNLKGFGSKLKKYANGLESETVEFKTSFIFPPKDATYKNQREAILKVINAFLNTQGGIVYIGVNDGGRGVGVENDLQSEPFFGDKDKYIRDITDSVKAEFGRMVAPYIKVYFDPDNADKDVLLIEVKKYPRLIPMRSGSYFLRTSNSKEGYTREEMAEVMSGLLDSEPVAEMLEMPVEEPEPQHEPVTPDPAPLRPTVDAIPTSRIRRNVLKSWDEGYVEPEAFLKFINPNELTKLSTYDYDEDSPLTLTVLADETSGYLILGYENGHIVKVPVDELLELSDNAVRKRYDGSKLIFASVAQSDDDLVLSIFKENKNNPATMLRLDRVADFESEQLQDSGRTPCNENLMGQVLKFDIVPSAYAEDFANSTGLDGTRAGHTLNKSSKMRTIINRLREFGFPEAL